MPFAFTTLDVTPKVKMCMFIEPPCLPEELDMGRYDTV